MSWQTTSLSQQFHHMEKALKQFVCWFLKLFFLWIIMRHMPGLLSLVVFKVIILCIIKLLNNYVQIVLSFLTVQCPHVVICDSFVIVLWSLGEKEFFIDEAPPSFNDRKLCTGSTAPPLSAAVITNSVACRKRHFLLMLVPNWQIKNKTRV